MKNNLGYNIKRKRRDPKKSYQPMKCYSCAIKSGGMFTGDTYEASEGNCDGFLKAVCDEMIVTECDGYIEQIFSMNRKDKKQLRLVLNDFLYHSVQDKHNITQQSDNWFMMEIELYAGILAMLQHREGFNKLQEIGRRFLAKHGNQIKNIEEDLPEVDDLFGKPRKQEVKKNGSNEK